VFITKVIPDEMLHIVVSVEELEAAMALVESDEEDMVGLKEQSWRRQFGWRRHPRRPQGRGARRRFVQRSA
jgi:hypothetical protein